MTDGERADMIAVALAHAAAEARCDLEATMATLDDDPVYELQPMGRILRGRDFARRYYEHFFANCLPRVTGYGLRSQWISDEGVLQEYELGFRNTDGTNTAHTIIGILVFGANGKLAGERIYAGDELINFMFGPFLAEP
jgi:hypothetical protein